MKLTESALRKMIIEEMKKFNKPKSTQDAAAETEEIDADGYAAALVKKISFAKALKLEEARLNERLKQIKREQKKIIEGV